MPAGCGGGGVVAESLAIGTTALAAGGGGGASGARGGGGTNCGGYGLEPGGAWDAWGTRNGVCCVCLPTTATAVCDGAAVLNIGCWDVVGGGIAKFGYCTVPGLLWNWG